VSIKNKMSLWKKYANSATLRGGWAVYPPDTVRGWTLNDWYGFEPGLRNVVTQLRSKYNISDQNLLGTLAMAYELDTAIQEGDEQRYRELKDRLRQANPVANRWLNLTRELIHRGNTRRSPYDAAAATGRRQQVRQAMRAGNWYGSDPFVLGANGRMSKSRNFAILQPTWGRAGLRRVSGARNRDPYTAIGVTRRVQVIRRGQRRGRVAAAVGQEAAGVAAAAAVQAVQQGAPPAVAIQAGAQAGAEQAEMRGEQIQQLQPGEGVAVRAAPPVRRPFTRSQGPVPPDNDDASIDPDNFEDDGDMSDD